MTLHPPLLGSGSEVCCVFEKLFGHRLAWASLTLVILWGR